MKANTFKGLRVASSAVNSRPKATFGHVWAPNFSKYGPAGGDTVVPENPMLWSRPRWPAGESIGSQTRSASDIESQKEANYVFSSWIRFAPAVAGRVFRVPRHRVLYPHSPVIGRSFHHLPLHARRCFCGLRLQWGRPREGAPPCCRIRNSH